MDLLNTNVALTYNLENYTNGERREVMSEKLKPTIYNHCFHAKGNNVHIENGLENQIVFIFQDKSFSVDADRLVDAIYSVKGKKDG